MYRRLLVPLDGSRLAEAALPLAERFAAAGGVMVVLLHVLERGAPTEVHGERHLSTADEASAYLDQVAARMQAEGIGVEQHVHTAPEADVARSIAAHGEEEAADLIVLSTHGKGRMRDLFFGSIAQQVLRHGTSPVLLARPAADGSAPAFHQGKVLVPLDATAAAEAALRPAADIARALGAPLHLVMVVATPDTIRGERLAGATLQPAATRAALELEQRDAIQYLEGIAAPLRAEGLEVTTEVRRGDAAASLAREAEGPDIALVVVATHGRAGLQAVWAGSVTAQLLSHTRAPILLLRIVEPGAAETQGET